MLTYILKLECIGDAQDARARAFTHSIAVAAGPEIAHAFRMPSQGPWVAELIGLSRHYGFERRFLPSKKDYSEANSIGSRGIYRYFELQEGALYEVSHKASWQRRERYLCQIRLGEPFRLTKEEAVTCLNALSA